MIEHWTRIRRRWWVIPVVVVIATAIALPLSVGRATTYTSKLALTTYSANRAPEQDAVLIQSYVDFFNTGANQADLREKAKVPSGVTMTAVPVATGPIMFVVATGTDENNVRAAAVSMGNAYRDSINAGVQQTRENSINTLRGPFLERIARQDYILDQERVELSRQIDQLNADTSGRLQDLDNAITVTATTPKVLPALSIAVLIGLLIGVTLAWLLGGLAPRLSRLSQVSESLGVRAFDVTARDSAGRRLQMRHVVNAMAFDELPVPTVLAVTSISGNAGSGVVTEELARIRAAQGADVVVVQTTHRGTGSALGVVDILRSPGTVTLDDALQSTERIGGIGAGVALVAPGHPAIDPYDVMTRANVGDLIDQLRKRFSVIVIECPPVTTSAEVQLLCSTADRTLVVVESEGTRPDEGRLAMRLLEESHAQVFGALVVAARSHSPVSFSFRRPAARQS